MNIKGNQPRASPNENINPANTFKSVCPAIIFANSRTDKLIGRTRYEISSIKIRRIVNGNGVPDGINNFKKPIPFLAKPVIVTPKKTTIAKANVTAMWLVTVNVYGIIPIRFANKMNIKSENMNGKNLRASGPADS